MAKINPILVDPTNVEQDPFLNVDASVIKWPSPQSPTENAYRQTADLEPDQAAQVAMLAKKVDQPPEFVGNNLDAVKKAAAMPPSDFFADVDKKYPRTSQFLSEPKNMAVAKDDIENLTKHDDLVQNYGVGRTMFNSLQAGFSKVNAQLAAIPDLALSLSAAAAGQPVAPKFPGGQEAVKFWQDAARAYTPSLNDQSITDVLKTGNVPLIAKTLTSKLIEGAPSLAMFMAANAAGGPAAGMAVAGVTSAAEVNARNTEMGLTPGQSSLNSIYHGAINAAFMNLGVVSPLEKWEAAIAQSVGADTARRVAVDMAKTIVGSSASFGASMGAMSLGGSMIDAKTGVNPKAMAGAGKRALDAMIEGAVTGGVLVGPSAILGGMARSNDLQRTQQTADFYTVLGDSAEASKLRARMPEAYREHIDQLTKGTPIESIGVPVEKFDTYFQSKKINPDDMAKDLGVFEQLATARDSGGDIQVPLSAWTEKMVKGGYYNDFKDDVRLHPEDQTVNEQNEAKAVVEKQVTEQADQAVKENPKLEKGRDFVYQDLKRQIESTKQVDPKVADAQAQLGAAAITRLATMNGIDPKDFYQKGAPLRVEGKEGKSATEGQRFNQGDPETDPRGFIQFTPKEALIKLVRADASTFPHELGHYWLKNFHEFIQTGQGTEQHQADWGTLKDWLKVGDDQKELNRDQQEKFAKGFESYLREGKAPSEDLRGVFIKFRRWLTKLYRDPITLGVELNDNVRGVMSRMLASEDEIAFAEKNAGIESKEYENIPGLDPKVKAKLDDLSQKAHEAAVTELMGKQMAELTVDHQTMLSKESMKARVAAEDEIKASEVQTAMRAVSKTFDGKDPMEVASKFHSGNMKGEDRATLEQVAMARGFSSADELAYKILNEPPVSQQVQERVDAHMAQFADIRKTDQIKEEAMKLVHGEKQIELMARESAIFRSMVDEAQGRAVDQARAATQAKLEAKAAQVKAEQLISAKSVADAGQFMPFFTAERNAAIKVKKALQEGDFEAAATAKRQQMLNHALVREAYAARQEIQKTLKFFDRFASRDQDLKNIPYGFIRQIDTLLSDHGLADPRTEDAKTYQTIAQDMAAKGDDPEEIAHRTGYVQSQGGEWRPETVSETIQRVQNDYRNINIPLSVLTSGAADYRSMSMGDFRDLKQAVKAINAVGRGYDNFLDENIKMDRKEAAAKFRADIESNIGTKYREERMIGSKAGETVFSRTFDAFNRARGILTPSLVNLYSFCDFLDHGDPKGLAKELIYRPLEHGLNEKLRMNEKNVKDMKAVMESSLNKKDYAKSRTDKVYIESLDRDMTKDQVQAFANNWGTQTGRDRLINGSKLTELQVKEILSKVSKEQWNFAQAQWDHNDKFWPQIVAQQQKVSGETPERVTPLSIDTPFGKYRGGYFPLKYDAAKSDEATLPVDARNALYKTQGAAAAHTSHGFTESRVQNYSQPVKLDSRVEFTHLEDVIHDLAFRQPIVDVASFLRQKDTREAIINAIGREGYDTIQKHVKWVGSEQGEYLNGLSDKLIQRLRFGSTIYTLGLRPATAPIFFTSNAINAIKDLGPIGFGNSIKDFLANREENVQFVDGKSPMMANRSTLMDRDLNDMAHSMQGDDRMMARLLFYPHQKADQSIAYPVWLHTYKEALAEHGEQKAIDLATEAVTGLLGDGSVLNQAMIQRGSESQKAWAWWYSWAGTQFNRMWRDGKMAGLEYDKGNIGTALTVLGTSLFFGVGLQGANEAMWRDIVFHNVPNGSEDDDKRNKRMGMRVATQGLGYVPIIGPVAKWGLEASVGLTSIKSIPTIPALESSAIPFIPLWEWAYEKYSGKESPHFWEDTANSAAMILKYPKWLNTLAFNFLDSVNDQGDYSWRDLMTRRTKS